MLHRTISRAAHGVLITSLYAAPALAQDTTGYDADLELVRPRFSPEILAGIDVPANERPGTVRWGLALQYQRAPLTLYEFDTEVGAIVGNRIATTLGASVDITRVFTARLAFPLIADFGTTVPRYGNDGFGTGDLELGMHLAFFRTPVVGLGARADLAVPTSQRDSYSGEKLPRLSAGFLTMVDAGRARIASDLGVNIRFDDVLTTERLHLSHELLWNLGVRVNVVPSVLDLGIAGYSRFGLSNFGGMGETSVEGMLIGGWTPKPAIRVQVGLGRGFTHGYGTTDVRAFAGLVFQRVPPVKVTDEDANGENGANGDGSGGLTFNVKEIKPSDVVKESDWDDGELARIDEKSARIVIRDAIRFEVGTARIVPESKATLEFVANLLNTNALIGHVLIEGHSSEDGDYAPNYKLSIDRAESIWQRLVAHGVHPARMSYRGMGEVEPAGQMRGVGDLEASRRVQFHILRQYESWESPPQYEHQLRLPWDGTDKTFTPASRPDDEDGLEPLVRPDRGPPEEIPDFDFEGGDDDETPPVEHTPLLDTPDTGEESP